MLFLGSIAKMKSRNGRNKHIQISGKNWSHMATKSMKNGKYDSSTLTDQSMSTMI